MIIKYILLFVIIQSSFVVLSQVKDIVKEFHCLEGKLSESDFIQKYQNNKNVGVKGYVISLKMKRAKYVLFPWKKLRYYNTGKFELEQLIKIAPENIHLRYIRLFIQERSPRFLGYDNNINEDKGKLVSYLDRNKSYYLAELIKKNTSI